MMAKLNLKTLSMLMMEMMGSLSNCVTKGPLSYSKIQAICTVLTWLSSLHRIYSWEGSNWSRVVIGKPRVRQLTRTSTIWVLITSSNALPLSSSSELRVRLNKEYLTYTLATRFRSRILLKCVARPTLRWSTISYNLSSWSNTQSTDKGCLLILTSSKKSTRMPSETFSSYSNLTSR